MRQGYRRDYSEETKETGENPREWETEMQSRGNGIKRAGGDKRVRRKTGRRIWKTGERGNGTGGDVRQRQRSQEKGTEGNI
jgi:hypothetical protein